LLPLDYELQPLLADLMDRYFGDVAEHTISNAAEPANISTPVVEPATAPGTPSTKLGSMTPSPLSPNAAVHWEALSGIGMAPALSLPNPQRPRTSSSLSLNPKAREFVPNLSNLSPVLSITAMLALDKTRAPEKPKGTVIRYSINELMAMRPLNPNAEEFVPGGYMMMNYMEFIDVAEEAFVESEVLALAPTPVPLPAPIAAVPEPAAPARRPSSPPAFSKRWDNKPRRHSYNTNASANKSDKGLKWSELGKQRVSVV
jgi:hypothetical protein